MRSLGFVRNPDYFLCQVNIWDMKMLQLAYRPGKSRAMGWGIRVCCMVRRWVGGWVGLQVALGFWIERFGLRLSGCTRTFCFLTACIVVLPSTYRPGTLEQALSSTSRVLVAVWVLQL